MSVETQVKALERSQKSGMILTVSFLVCGILAQILLNLQMNRIEFKESLVPVEKAKKIDPQLFQVFTFGHLPMAIDWLWIQCMLDAGNDPVKRGDHPQLYYHFDLITDLDPFHFQAYEIGANLLAIARNDGAGARDLLLKAQRWIQLHGSEMKEGLLDQQWEKVWKIHLLLGYVYLFELSDMPNAAEAFILASQGVGAPRYLESLAKRLQAPGGQYEVGIRLVNALLLSEQNPRSKEELEKKRTNLLVSQFLFEKNSSFKEYLKKQPSYLHSTQVLENYLRLTKIGNFDPWGGKLSINQNGMIVSTTPHESVFGLE